MKPKGELQSRKTIQTKEPSENEVINRAILVISGFVAMFANYFIDNKTITRPIDLIALLVATYAIVKLSRNKSFKHNLAIFALAFGLVAAIILVFLLVFLMIVVF